MQLPPGDSQQRVPSGARSFFAAEIILEKDEDELVQLSIGLIVFLTIFLISSCFADNCNKSLSSSLSSCLLVRKQYKKQNTELWTGQVRHQQLQLP